MFRTIFIGCLLGLNFAMFSAKFSKLQTSEPCVSPTPNTVPINAVSVNPLTNQVEIFWTPIVSSDISGYVVFEGEGAGFTDTIWGADQSRFLSQKIADIKLEFRLAAINQCSERGTQSVPKYVFMCKIEQRSCEKKINVSWSDATQSIVDIAYFEIWLSKNDGNFERVDSVDASQNSAVVEAFGHLQRYKIYVRAVSSDPTIFANSIADTLTLISAPEPNYAYLKTVSVINNETVEIRCSVDVSVVWKNLFAYMDGSPVRTLSYDDFLKNNALSLPRKNAIYHFEISDTCGEIAIRSNRAKPVLLEATLQDSAVDLRFSELWFDPVQDWFGFIRYDVLQILDGDTTVKSGLSPDVPYQFTISNLGHILTLSYVVIVYDGAEIARSNVVDVISRNEIPVHFPTGFVPGGITPIYRPIYVSQERDVMRFRIFNKFGQLVFSTDNPNNGWDGTFNNNGTDCQPAVYVYQFELTRNGRTMHKRGSIVLIR
jgi:hypothetical protein